MEEAAAMTSPWISVVPCAVRPSVKGQGVGRALLQLAETEAVHRTTNPSIWQPVTWWWRTARCTRRLAIGSMTSAWSMATLAYSFGRSSVWP